MTKETGKYCNIISEFRHTAFFTQSFAVCDSILRLKLQVFSLLNTNIAVAVLLGSSTSLPFQTTAFDFFRC
jgi:hypothetical protein